MVNLSGIALMIIAITFIVVGSHLITYMEKKIEIEERNAQREWKKNEQEDKIEELRKNFETLQREVKYKRWEEDNQSGN